jgi:hypothetical protein
MRRMTNAAVLVGALTVWALAFAQMPVLGPSDPDYAPCQGYSGPGGSCYSGPG